MNWEQLLASQVDASSPPPSALIAAQFGLPADHVLLAVGEQALTSALMRACCPSSHHCLLPQGPLEAIAHSLSLNTLSYGRGPDLTLDVAALLPHTTHSDLALTWISSPDLITGMALTPSQLHLLLTDGNGLVVVDNRYALLSEQDYRAFVGHPRLILMQSLPIWPWSRLELFWLAAPPDLLARLSPYLALPAWLEQAVRQLPLPDLAVQVEALLQKRQRVYLNLLGKGASPLLSEGPFVLVQGSSPLPAQDAPGLPGYQRIDLA